LDTKSPDDDVGYILEVDIEYPPHIHDKHNDYPLAAEKLIITQDMLSPYAKSVSQKIGCHVGLKNEKLAPNLLNKKNYVTHYRNLQFYLKMGLKLAKVHKILEFRQCRWLKPYIDFNTAKRQVAKIYF